MICGVITLLKCLYKQHKVLWVITAVIWLLEIRLYPPSCLYCLSLHASIKSDLIYFPIITDSWDKCAAADSYVPAYVYSSLSHFKSAELLVTLMWSLLVIRSGRWLISQMRLHVFLSSCHHAHAASKRPVRTVHNTQLSWQAVDSCFAAFTTSTHPEQDVRVGTPAVRHVDAPTRVQFTSVPQVANARKHCFQHAGLLIINELLHHWQNQCYLTGEGLRRGRTHTHTLTHMHAEESVWTCMCSHPHAFYQSNLAGKSMIWLANRELMQSRGLRPPLPSQSSLIYLSHVPLLLIILLPLFSLFFPPSCFLVAGNKKTTAAHWVVGATHPAGRWARWHSLLGS